MFIRHTDMRTRVERRVKKTPRTYQRCDSKKKKIIDTQRASLQVLLANDNEYAAFLTYASRRIAMFVDAGSYFTHTYAHTHVIKIVK